MALTRARSSMIEGASVNVLDYQSSGETDITLAFRRAAVANPDKRLALPPGQYTAETTFQVGDLDDLYVDATGAEIEIKFNGTFLRAAGPTYTNIQTISAVDDDDIWSVRRIVTCTDGSVYNVNDLVYVVSDDKLRGTRADPGDGTNYRTGFMAFIESISGNDITLDAPIPFDLTTNPRIGVMPRRRYQWHGGLLAYETGHDDTWSGQAIVMYGVSDLNVKVEIEHAYGPAIKPVGCFNTVINAKGRDIENDEPQLQFGYLVDDISFYCQATVNAGINRHAYTTSKPLVAANSDELHLYGMAYGGRIAVFSNGNSQGGADTHHGSENITFVNPVVSGGMAGGGQLVLRGIGHTVINPVLRNGRDGIFVYTETGVTDPTDVTIIGADVEVDKYPLQVDVQSKIKLTGGGRFRSFNYGKVWQIDGDLNIEGDFFLRPGGPNDLQFTRAIELYDSTVDARLARLFFDLQDVPASATNYGIVQGDGLTLTTWKGGELIVANDTNMSAVFYEKNLTAATVNFGGGLKIVTDSLGNSPALGMSVTGADGVGFTSAWSWRHYGNDGGTNYIEKPLTANDQTFNWYNRFDDVVLVKLTASSSYDLGALGDGTFIGQSMNISAETTSSAQITIQHGVSFNTYLPGAVDKVLDNGDGILLFWDGSVWRT